MQTRGRKHNWKQVGENVFSISLFCIYFSSWERTPYCSSAWQQAGCYSTPPALSTVTQMEVGGVFNFCIEWLRQTCCDKDRMNCKPWGVHVISIHSTAEVKMLDLFKLLWITMSGSLPFTHSSCVYSKLTVERFHWTHASKIFSFHLTNLRKRRVLSLSVKGQLSVRWINIKLWWMWKPFWSKCWK